MTGTGAYLAVFLLMTLAFIGIPAVGPAVVGWAAVLASQGKLNIVRVLIAAGCAVLAARYYRRRRARICTSIMARAAAPPGACGPLPARGR